MKLVKKLLIVTIIMVIMLSNNLIFATGQTDTNNSETNTGQVSNSSRIIVLDAGHGTEGPSEASGWINNGSEWGEWRHFKEGTYGQNCNGCNQPGTSQYGCWYPYSAGTRPEIEPTLTWKMTTAAQKYLQSKDYTVRLTKSSMAEDPSMTKRATYCFPGNDITKNPDAEIFVCIHSNAGGGTGSCYMNLDTSSGHYKQGYIPADYAARGNALGKSINDAIVSQTSLGAYSNGVFNGNENVILFHKNPVTTAYLEIGFYDDGSPDLPILQSESDKIGQAIADGIDSYLQGVAPSVNTGSTGGNGTASGAIEKGKITTQSNEDKFLGLWKNKVGKYVPYYEDPENAKFDPNGIKVVYPGYGAPVSVIFGGTDWFFSLLQESENAQYDENLMRYLMYKYTEGRTSYGVTEFDFSMFDISAFTSASGFNCNDFVVKTDEGNTAPVLTKEQLTQGLNSWLKNQQQLSNALSVIDKVIECQDKYKVNGVFIYALMMDETTMGTANTDWVAEKNWCSLTSLGHRDWGTPQNNIDRCAWNIAEGDYYFKQGLYTVHEIGEVYCANPPPPAWGDAVQGFMKELYEAAGVDLSQFIGGDILQVAEQCWQWVIQNNPTYGGCSIPPTSTVDCSGFVTWVLYEMGYTEFSYQWTTQTFIDNQEQLKSKYGWEIIPISSGQDISDIVQPGDIIDRSTGDGGSGHMNIAVACENGTLMAYDCGNRKNWTERTNGGPIDRSYFLATDGYGGPGKPGIIIRGVNKP